MGDINMMNKNNFSLKINGKNINTDKLNIETLYTKQSSRTVVDQSNPLLERASQILASL